MLRFQRLLFVVMILTLSGLVNNSAAQISAPKSDWQGLTTYTYSTKQDSIFVFFSTETSPKKGSLTAKFSCDSTSTFSWYKYNENISTLANRFELYTTESGVKESTLENLDNGGYRVKITNSEDSTETYTVWVFVDSVAIATIDYENTCDYLLLEATTSPNRYTVVNDEFIYYDISRTSSHTEINTYSSKYFKKISWSASNSSITVPTTSNLSISIEDPAPLYDAAYTIQITNIFGRTQSLSTETIAAIATQANFTINVDDDKDGIYSDGGDSPEGEAPLALELISSSINADSIFWQIINDEDLFYYGGDSIIWRDSSMYSTAGVYPDENKMVPGEYPVEHIAVNTTSGCRDTATITVTVDSSMIKSEAIPNVFSPNGDGVNDLFLLIDAETNISSIKSFNVYILSRWGKKVYEYHGDPKEWEGWNGKIDGEKGDAAEGVYFYIIEAVGYDKKNYKGGVYKGFLHLFRGK